jgi:hypothetical protein
LLCWLLEGPDEWRKKRCDRATAGADDANPSTRSGYQDVFPTAQAMHGVALPAAFACPRQAG